MKAGLLASGLLLMGALSPQALASGVSCSPVEVVEESHESSDYSFIATLMCSAPSSQGMDEIRQQILDILKTHGRITSSMEDTSVNGMNGTSFTYRDNGYDTGHGTITITYDSYLVSNESRVSYEGLMIEKDANSYADHTQAVTVNIDIEHANDELSLTLVKHTTITKPVIAPGFQKAVSKGLTKEVNILAHPYIVMLNSL